jgi:hypothetical protein
MMAGERCAPLGSQDRELGTSGLLWLSSGTLLARSSQSSMWLFSWDQDWFGLQKGHMHRWEEVKDVSTFLHSVSLLCLGECAPGNLSHVWADAGLQTGPEAKFSASSVLISLVHMGGGGCLMENFLGKNVFLVILDSWVIPGPPSLVVDSLWHRPH